MVATTLNSLFLKFSEAHGTQNRSLGEWKVEEARHFSGIAGDKGLVVTEAARHYAALAAFDKPLDPSGKDLVVQYEVRLQEGLDCGGAYLKLPSSSTNFKPKDFNNDTPYVIMFGPDKCGGTNKVHFIFRHQNPLTKQWEEKHLKNPPSVKLDKLTHLYTLHVKPDNSFEIFIDQVHFTCVATFFASSDPFLVIGKRC
jgi:calnexin